MSRTGTGVPGLGRGFSAMAQGLGGDGRASLSAQRTPGTPVKVQPHDYNGYLAIVGRGAAIRARRGRKPTVTDACRRSPTTTRSRR